MSKHNIKCQVLYDTRREWEVTPEGRLWPCCYFANAYDKKTMTHADETLNQEDADRVNDESATLFDDPVMSKLLKDDPDFNNLEKHTLDEIIKHDVHQKYIHHEGWKSDNPPLCCIANCTVGQDK
jgi:hypothetical protein